MVETINEYISQFPEDIQKTLQSIRKTIQEAVPEASEKISYGMPTFYLNGNLIHFAAFKKHIGLYPAPSGIEKFKDKLLEYKTSKGTIQFPFTKEIPYELITEIVNFRVIENAKKNKK